MGTIRIFGPSNYRDMAATDWDAVEDGYDEIVEDALGYSHKILGVGFSQLELTLPRKREDLVKIIVGLAIAHGDSIQDIIDELERVRDKWLPKPIYTNEGLSAE